MQGGTSLDVASEKLRALLATIDKQSNEERLGENTKELIKSHLAEHQDALREMQERLRMSSEDMEMNRARRVELESLLDKREGAYDDLLGELVLARLQASSTRELQLTVQRRLQTRRMSPSPKSRSAAWGYIMKV